MKRPLTGIAVAYASGIWIGSRVTWPLLTLFLLAAACLVVFLVVRRTRFGFLALFTAILVLGMCGDRQAATAFSPIDITRQLELRDQNVELQG